MIEYRNLRIALLGAGSVGAQVADQLLTHADELAARVGDVRFVKRFARANRPGAYLAITREGELGAGDAVEVLERPDHDVTIALMNEATVIDRSKLPLL
ncbi:MAG: hypothetical protein ACLGH5_09185, partial [Actinomycetes bacterium]